MTTSAASIVDALSLINDELTGLSDRFATTDPATLERFTALVGAAPRIFVHGAGRSGLALRMTAMRLMHLGRVVHVVGDVTTPAIAAGDLLLVASGSGTTEGILRVAHSATAAGADIATITTAPGSPLADLSTVTVVVPAAQKQDRTGEASSQYAGGLFEQFVMLLGDALFHALWKRSGVDADELWKRHANLE
jgi:6-phospho-3-hexuloisomerase